MPTTPPTFVAGDILEADQLNLLGDGIVELQAVTEAIPFCGVKLTRGASQSIGDSVDTNITWTVETFDVGGWWSSGNTIIVPAGAIPSGYTTIAVVGFAMARFVSNGTGSRRLAIVHDGVDEAIDSRSALSGETTSVTSTEPFTVAAGDAITMRVYQSSGGSLNCDVARLSIIRLAPVS